VTDFLFTVRFLDLCMQFLISPQSVELVKWYISLWGIHLRAKEHHLPYVITQCYLPPDTGECIPP